MKQMQKGFTLIELMIVVAIIGILAAIAIPQYQDYITRAKWQDNLVSVESYKLAIAECVQNSAGVTSNCLTPANVGLTALPTLSNGTLATPTAPTASSVAMVITGTALVASCVVTLTGTSGETNMSWAFTNGGGCTKRKTGVGT